MPITGQTNPELFPLYYERKLLEYVKANLIATRYGQKYSFKPNQGRAAVFTRFSPLQTARSPLTNQQTPSTGASISTQQVQVQMQEYGNYIDLDEFTDITSFASLVDVATDLLSYNAQESLDAVAMAELTSGTNIYYAGGVLDRGSLDGTNKLSKDDILKGVSLLRRANIPTFPDGYYVLAIHPDKLLDIFTAQELLTLSQANVGIMEKGVVGAFGGAKIVISTTLPILTGQGGGTPASDVYQSILLGLNAYGVVDLNGNSIQMTYTNVDKLGRIKTIGWKSYFAVKRLYEPAIVRIESN